MSYKLLITIFLLSLITINSEHVKNGEKWFKSTIYIGADDQLLSLTLNDNEVYTPNLLLNNWLSIQTVDLVLFPGDELVFTVKNNAEEFTIDDPGAFAARIEYVNQNGETTSYLTNTKDWTCDGREPKSFGTVYKNLRYLNWQFQKLGDDVELIWGAFQKQTTKCRFTIPQ